MRGFLLLVGLILCIGVDARKRKVLPRWHIRMAQEQGANACAVEEVPELRKQYWTECKYWMHRKICGKNTIIRYECCEGYERIPGEKGCTRVKPLKDVLETAEDLGATIFIQHIKEAGLESQLRKTGALTLFVPTNAAFETISQDQRNLLAKSYNNPNSPILLYHLVNKRVHSKDFHSDLLVETAHPGHNLKLNKYSSGIMTANCIPVIRKDQEASNGVVHLIENVLAPQNPRNVFDSMSEDGRFEQLSQMVRDTGLSSQLQDNDHFFTIFAPSDEEFTNIPRSRRNQIRNDITAKLALSENHILPHTVCLPAIVDEHKMTTLKGNKLKLHCNETGLYVENSRITGEQITGSNGVIHLISRMIVPDRAKSVWELASDNGLELFSHFARRTGLEAQLENYGDITVFAFTDEAFKAMDQVEQDNYIQDMQETRELLRYHIAPGKYLKDSITDYQNIQTLDGKNALRARIYRKGCGIETAMMTKTDIEGLNGVLHIIDHVLKPPKNNILDVLQNDGNYTIISEAIQKVSKNNPEFFNVTRYNSGAVTFLAPSDEAFKKLGDARLRNIMEDTSVLTKILNNHIVENMYSSNSFRSELHYSVQTKQSSLDIQKKSQQLQIGDAHVVQPDIVTKEGIVFTVDAVLMPEEITANVAANHHSNRPRVSQLVRRQHNRNRGDGKPNRGERKRNRGERHRNRVQGN